MLGPTKAQAPHSGKQLDSLLLGLCHSLLPPVIGDQAASVHMSIWQLLQGEGQQTCGGFMMVLRFSPVSSGLFSLNMPNTRSA